MKEIICLENLCLQRGNKLILDNINWSIKENENWILLGANGSGKTSLLSSMTAYVTPSSGLIKICDNVYGEDNWIKLREKIGIVSASLTRRFEETNTALEVVVSGKEAMINFWGKIKKTDKLEALSLMRDFECENLKDSLWINLSQGERQKILICRALMSQLDILILDEPCSQLDPAAREDFLKFISKISVKKMKNLKSIIFVTHHIEEILPSFKKTLILQNSKVMMQGNTVDLINSKNLSNAYNKKITVENVKKRFRLKTF